MFSVIENGQPRWLSIPSQSYDEGDDSTEPWTIFDRLDGNGNPTSVASLSLAIVSVEPADILNADFLGAVTHYHLHLTMMHTQCCNCTSD